MGKKPNQLIWKIEFHLSYKSSWLPGNHVTSMWPAASPGNQSNVKNLTFLVDHIFLIYVTRCIEWAYFRKRIFVTLDGFIRLAIWTLHKFPAVTMSNLCLILIMQIAKCYSKKFWYIKYLKVWLHNLKNYIKMSTISQLFQFFTKKFNVKNTKIKIIFFCIF